MNPNLEQVLAIVRWLLSVGGPLGAYLVSRGIPADQVTNLQASAIAIGGALPPVISFVWGLMAHTHANAIAVVDAIPAVKGIVTQPTPDGIALAKSIPSSTVASAGTLDANNIAKAAPLVQKEKTNA